jgi:hypothetical protein
MMEALRRSHPKRKDATLLATGAGILEDALRPHGFKFGGVREEKADKRSVAVGSSSAGAGASSCRCAPASALRSGRPASGACSTPTTWSS